MKALGWSDIQFAKAIGKDKSYVSKLLNPEAKSNPTISTLQDIATSLGVGLDFLFSDTPDNTTNSANCSMCVGKSPPLWVCEYLKKTLVVVTSGYTTADALKSNIDEFYETVQLKNEKCGLGEETDPGGSATRREAM